MDLEFVDTNVIVRAVTDDDLNQKERARRLFRRVEDGEAILTTCESVLVEVVQVLSSKRLYGWPRGAIRDYLVGLLNLVGFQIPGKRSYLRALELYGSTNIDFVDALNIAHMERAGITTILSFDKDFDDVPDINRREP